VTRIRLVGRVSGGRCVFCHDGLQGDVERCPECRAAWHEDCRPSDGHCHTLGCTAPAPQPSPAARAEPGPRAAPAWTVDGRRPGWAARLGPYSRLYASAVAHLTLCLVLLTGVLVALVNHAALWRAFGGRGTADLVLGLLVGAGTVGAASAAIAWSGRWLLRLPGVVNELHALLEETTPVLMELTVEKEVRGRAVNWYARLTGRHGEFAGQEHLLEVRGLLPPWWLTSFERSAEPVLVYGLPPPGPYVIEFQSGALALLHPE